MTVMRCNKCERELSDPDQKFCSLECEQAWDEEMQERLDSAHRNDKSHKDTD